MAQLSNIILLLLQFLVAASSSWAVNVRVIGSGGGDAEILFKRAWTGIPSLLAPCLTPQSLCGLSETDQNLLKAAISVHQGALCDSQCSEALSNGVCGPPKVEGGRLYQGANLLESRSWEDILAVAIEIYMSSSSIGPLKVATDQLVTEILKVKSFSKLDDHLFVTQFHENGKVIFETSLKVYLVSDLLKKATGIRTEGLTIDSISSRQEGSKVFFKGQAHENGRYVSFQLEVVLADGEVSETSALLWN